MKPAVAVGLVLLAVGALMLRLPQLDERPLHTDESVHAIKFLGLWEGAGYRYDPHEYHGPSLYYATLPLAWLSGARTRAELSETVLRLSPVLWGTVLVLLLGLTWRLMGTVATLWAGVFTAVSPVMVYYSRYFIHETLLIAFTFGFLGFAWRYWRDPRRGWMLGAGVCLGLMHATKETLVFPLAAAAGATLAAWGWARLREEPSAEVSWKGKDLAWGLAVAGAVSLMFFTSFFSNWQGLLDAWRTYGPWLARAEGDSPHVHPWSFYWTRLLYTRVGQGPTWSEGMIFGLGLVGMVRALGAGQCLGMDRGWARWLTFYTLLLSAAYTVIPYKTPWCVLGFWHGWILLAGIGVASAMARLRWLPWRAALAGVLVLGTWHLGLQAHRATIRYGDSQRNPWVYAHTLSSVLDLVDRVQAIAEVAKDEPLIIKVMTTGGDYWPLPWYLREHATGWYAGVPVQPDEAFAPVVIASPELAPDLREVLGDQVQALGMFGLRPGVFLQLHVEPGLWEQYLDRDRD